MSKPPDGGGYKMMNKNLLLLLGSHVVKFPSKYLWLYLETRVSLNLLSEKLFLQGAAVSTGSHTGHIQQSILERMLRTRDQESRAHH